jgi:hypothetical protein
LTLPTVTVIGAFLVASGSGTGNDASHSVAWSLSADNTIVASETINVSIPNAEGVFTMTVSNTPVQLSDAVLSADRTTFESTGQLGAVTVSDARNQTQPGWSVSGQVGDFSGGGHTFSGGNLSWTPMVVERNPAGDVDAGPTVASGTNPGLTGGSNLARAAAMHGRGICILGATLDLKLPVSTHPSAYSATLTITTMEQATP